MHFGRYVAKAKLVCVKTFVPVTRAEVFTWENFHPGRKTEISVTGPPIEVFKTERVPRRDLGNRVSLGDRAHMKRPSVSENLVTVKI